MGKQANWNTWDQFKPLQNAPEEWEEPEPQAPLTEAERASQWDHPCYDRIDRDVPRRVRLYDEM